MESMLYSKLMLTIAPPIDYKNKLRLHADIADNDFANLMLLHTLELLDKVNAPVEDETMPFHLPDIKTVDMSESDCISYLRFRKEDVQVLAHELWPRVSLFFPQDSTYDAIQCKYKYKTNFETGLMMVLYRLARPVRLRPDMERYWHVRKSRLSSIIQTFVTALHKHCDS